jgi:hypothetical protein
LLDATFVHFVAIDKGGELVHVEHEDHLFAAHVVSQIARPTASGRDRRDVAGQQIFQKTVADPRLTFDDRSLSHHLHGTGSSGLGHHLLGRARHLTGWIGHPDVPDDAGGQHNGRHRELLPFGAEDARSGRRGTGLGRTIEVE